MYKFCNPFEGDFVNNEYIMTLTTPFNCGKIINNKACMCKTHINYNQKVVLELKLDQKRRLIEMGVPQEDYYEDFLEANVPDCFEPERGRK